MSKRTYAAGVLFRAPTGRFLFLKRPDGVWGIPAGKIEPSETSAQAAARETWEETRYVCSRPLLPGFNDVRGGVDFTMFNYEADGEFSPTLNYEHLGFVWADLDELPSPLFPGFGERLITSFAMDEREYDLNGWFEIQDNPISRVGVYPYRGKNIKGAPDPDAMYMVYRPAEELKDPMCINSFRLVPWVDNHTMLGEGEKLTPVESRTIEGVLGEQIYFDEADQTLKGNLKCWTNQHQDKIDGGKRELSLGYRCRYEYVPGVWNGIKYDYVQRTMRGNHLASVNDGRMGPDVAVMDGFSFTVDSREFKAMGTKVGVKKGPAAKPVNKVSKLVASLLSFAQDEDESADVPAGELEQFQQLVDKVAPLLEQLSELPTVMAQPSMNDEDDDETDPANVVLDTAVTDPAKKPDAIAKDATDPTKKDKDDVAMDASDLKAMIASEIKKGIAAAVAGMTPAMDEKEIISKARRRADLAEKLSHFVGVFDSSDMTLAEVEKYGVEKLGIPNVAAGQESGAIAAYLHGRVAPTHDTRRLRAVGGAQFAMDGKEAGDNPVDAFINGFKG